MKETMGHRIKRLREKMSWNQDQFASHMNVSKQTISNWETENKIPRMGAIESMATLFKVSKSYIIDGKEDANSVDLDDVFENKEHPIMTYQGKPIPEEDMELIKRILKGK